MIVQDIEISSRGNESYLTPLIWLKTHLASHYRTSSKSISGKHNCARPKSCSLVIRTSKASASLKVLPPLRTGPFSISQGFWSISFAIRPQEALMTSAGVSEASIKHTGEPGRGSRFRTETMVETNAVHRPLISCSRSSWGFFITWSASSSPPCDGNMSPSRYKRLHDGHILLVALLLLYHKT